MKHGYTVISDQILFHLPKLSESPGLLSDLTSILLKVTIETITWDKSASI